MEASAEFTGDWLRTSPAAMEGPAKLHNVDVQLFGGRVSVGLAVAIIACSILLGLRVFPWDYVVFLVPGADARPWTALTYSFGCGIVCALFNGMALASFGSSVERDIGSAKIAVFYAVASVLGALGCWVGALLLGVEAILGGPWLWVSAVTVAYGTRYPMTQISLMGLVLIQARWLAWGSVVLTLAAVVPMSVGIFTALSLIFAWAFAAGKIPFFPYGKPLATVQRPTPSGRGMKTQDQSYFDDVRRREKEREERERLRKLFEGSVKDAGDD